MTTHAAAPLPGRTGVRSEENRWINEKTGTHAFLMATYAVVLFSLLLQAPTLGPLLRRLDTRPAAK